ncbi:MULTISPECIES: serine O-acetyltransferase [Serratia]|uniref:serine O-acetyltransferase n=1 Tax=Serratia TaxID=613 RepID=UPI000E2BBE62|nr:MULTISPECIES: serine acetyltransferase [Serratia]RDL17375.1 serine O-acetyltransferase [Serratia fonticola]
MLKKVKHTLKDNRFLFPLSLYLYRVFFLKLRSIPRWFSDKFYATTYYDHSGMLTSCHLTIGIKQLYDKRTILPHPVGIVIGKNVKLGLNCTIYQNVTIGVKNVSSEQYPILGDNVIIYANACICGNIRIGNNSIIGAGSLVLFDVPDNAIVSGNPATIIRYRDN